MTLEKAKRKLYDTTFLLGRFRRRAAIRELLEAPDPAGVLMLAEALGGNHPQAPMIVARLRTLSPTQDADKVVALWQAWAAQPQPMLAGVLATLGWPPGRAVGVATARAVLAAATAEAASAIQHAVMAFARALPVTDEAMNTTVYLAWIRTQSKDLEHLLTEPGRSSTNLALEALHATPPAVTTSPGGMG